ncbi:hypothetical protein C4D60_Mb11t21070 [Musa balbisiana]|uniref:NPH3 domain-containing protein n=1 Tax=Musa balbisiana TaxID=52838 RepID=A0A4S8J5X6_MUSBA|nr:hypothetical protein C4D60_Mb11t21070 [Musa balbisiana]
MSSMLGMAASDLSSRLSAAMETTSHWDFSQDIPSDIVVQIGDATFQLHKFVLAAKSGYIRRKVMESESANLSCIDLSDLPIGAEVFERVAKFCYGVNFEISVRNVAALRCTAEYLQMTEEYCRGNLAARTEEFINQAAVKTLPGAACNESNRPTRSPPNWWAGELAALSPTSLQMILIAMKSRGADPKSLAAAVVVYAEKFLPHLRHPSSGTSAPAGGNDGTRERSLLESVVSILLPDCDAPLPVGFIFYLLRAAIFLEASEGCRRELERRASACLDQATVADLLTITLDYAGERVVDLETARRIVAGFAEREAGGGGGAVYKGDSGAACCSAAVQKVARTVDSFVGKIASDEELSVSKFTGIAGALPKSARRFDDDLYRAVDVYLKAHPGLDEIEREKASSVIDPLKLSYEARLHASQNKRLPLQIVLHALYYDQLKQRSGTEDDAAAGAPGATLGRDHGLKADVSLIRENEALRSELARMKMYVSELHRGGGGAGGGQGSGVKARSKKAMFFSSVSRTLGKLNPFKQGSKDTSNMDDGVVVDVTKPRRRRFSIS